MRLVDILKTNLNQNFDHLNQFNLNRADTDCNPKDSGPNPLKLTFVFFFSNRKLTHFLHIHNFTKQLQYRQLIRAYFL